MHIPRRYRAPDILSDSTIGYKENCESVTRLKTRDREREVEREKGTLPASSIIFGKYSH